MNDEQKSSIPGAGGGIRTNSSNSGRGNSNDGGQSSTYADPLVRPAVELPKEKSSQDASQNPEREIRYRSRDIGTKTAVRTNPFSRVEKHARLGEQLNRLFRSKKSRSASARSASMDDTGANSDNHVSDARTNRANSINGASDDSRISNNGKANFAKTNSGIGMNGTGRGNGVNNTGSNANSINGTTSMGSKTPSTKSAVMSSATGTATVNALRAATSSANIPTNVPANNSANINGNSPVRPGENRAPAHRTPENPSNQGSQNMQNNQNNQNNQNSQNQITHSSLKQPVNPPNIKATTTKSLLAKLGIIRLKSLSFLRRPNKHVAKSASAFTAGAEPHHSVSEINSTSNNTAKKVKTDETTKTKMPRPQGKMSALFTGARKFITIPALTIIVVETVLLVLFFTGILGKRETNINVTASEANTAEAVGRATSIYNDIGNLNSTKDTLEYWNMTIASAEPISAHAGYVMRMAAADFYIRHDDKETAFTILRETQIDYTVDNAERYRLYATVAGLAYDLGDEATMKEYLEKTKSVSNGNF